MKKNCRDKKQLQLNKFDVILIKWNDAGGSPSWQSIEDYKSWPFTVNTVGHFIGSSDDHIIVAQNHDWSNGNIGHVMHIPPAMITHIEILRRASRTKKK